MPQDHTEHYSAMQRRFLEITFALAQTGNHADHRTLYVELERHADFGLVRHDFEPPAVRKQVDSMCAHAVRGAITVALQVQ